MAQATLDVRVADRGLAYTGPVGAMDYGAMGVSSEASAIASQEPIAVSSVADVDTLIGIGPLRDALVHSLSRTGGTILTVPLQRASGGTPVGGATAVIDGELEVTPNATGYALGRQEVNILCTLGGAAGTAEFRLVVDGVPGAVFSPGATDFGSDLDGTVLTDAVLGSLATGVAAADHFTFEMATSTAFVAGELVTVRFNTARPAGASLAPAVQKLADLRNAWEGILAAGVLAPASWTLLQTAVRDLPSRGRFPFVVVQAAGPDLRTDASAATTTAAWNSALVVASAPTREDDPRLSISTFWCIVEDPATGRDSLQPFLYPAMGHLAARQVQHPPDATKYGAVEGVKSIYPADIGSAHWNAQDNVWYMTAATYPGEDGVYINHWRMYGEHPAPGVIASDFSGIERRRVMDETSRRVYVALFPHLNEDLETAIGGRLAAGAALQLSSEATSAVQLMVAEQRISAGAVTVTDEPQGILRTGVVLVTISIQPRGKAERIQATIGFRVTAAVEAA